LTPKGHTKDFTQKDEEGLFDWLAKQTGYDYQLVVMEDFRLYAHKAQQQIGSDMQAVKVIGIITTWARLNKIPVVMQMPTIKAIAEKWTKVEPTGDHNRSHWVDAYNHGMYYLIKNGYVKVHET
jgi:hypothetical protein